MIVSLFDVFAASHGTYGNLVYLDNGKTVTNTGYSGEPTTVTIPGSINGRTLVPLRFVGEAFGCNVNWDASSRTVYITVILPELDNMDTNSGGESNE